MKNCILMSSEAGINEQTANNEASIYEWSNRY